MPAQPRVVVPERGAFGWLPSREQSVRFRGSSSPRSRKERPQCSSRSRPSTKRFRSQVHAYAEKRLSKLSRRLYEGTLVELTFSREHNPSIRDDHVAEGVVFMKGPNVVAREAAPTYETAVDRLVDKLERQIERVRDKRVREPRRAAQRKRDGEAGEEAA